ncbi:MAG: hypothetical protein KDA87_26980, partial [Planctomycetales bacterium]|nr:hypothetical protein [Planctomycetales bacterium]
WRYPPKDLRYGFPVYSSDLDMSRIVPPGRGSYERLTDPQNGSLLGTITRFLSLRESVWARAVNPSRRVNIGGVLRSVGTALLNADQRAATRGELTRAVTSTGFVLLGHFPHSDGHAFPSANVRDAIRAELSSLNSQFEALDKHLMLYIVVVRNQGMLPGCTEMQCDAYHETFSQFEDFIERLDSRFDNIRISALRTPDIGSAALELVSYLPLAESSSLLSRSHPES